MSKVVVRRVIVGIMLASLILAVTFDTYVKGRPEFEAVYGLAKELRILGQPFLLFSVSSLLGVIAAIVGASLYIFERRSSRPILLISALLTLISYRMVSVSVSTDVSGAAGFIFALCLGWLIATPTIERNSGDTGEVR